MKKIFILCFLLIACEIGDRSTMNSVRLKSDATTDSIEHVVKEMLIAISTNDIEKVKYHVLEEGRVFRIRKDGIGFRSNTDFFKQTADQSTDYFERIHALNLKNPQIVGFGISNQETFKAATKTASGAIIGSAFIKHLNKHGVHNIGDFIDSIRPSS